MPVPLRVLSQVGPVTVAIAASSWSTYESGVFTSTESTVNHAVLLVGYGETDAGEKFWKVRNSWGASYGEGGRSVQFASAALFSLLAGRASPRPSAQHTSPRSLRGRASARLRLSHLAFSGYIRMKRSDDDGTANCAMDEDPLVGITCALDENGNKIDIQPVQVCGINGILFDVVYPTGVSKLE